MTHSNATPELRHATAIAGSVLANCCWRRIARPDEAESNATTADLGSDHPVYFKQSKALNAFVTTFRRSDSERSDNLKPVQLSVVLLDQFENLLTQ
jgi:hypothetical protein